MYMYTINYSLHEHCYNTPLNENIDTSVLKWALRVGVRGLGGHSILQEGEVTLVYYAPAFSPYVHAEGHTVHTPY